MITPQRPACLSLYGKNLSVIARDAGGKKDVWWGAEEGVLQSVRFIWLSWDRSGQDDRACSAGRTDVGRRGMLTAMHQGVGGQADSSVPEMARYRITHKNRVCFVCSWAMSSVHWHVGMFHFRDDWTEDGFFRRHLTSWKWCVVSCYFELLYGIYITYWYVCVYIYMGFVTYMTNRN